MTAFVKMAKSLMKTKTPITKCKTPQGAESEIPEQAQEGPTIVPDGATCEGEQVTASASDDPRGVMVGGISGHSMMKPISVALW